MEYEVRMKMTQSLQEATGTDFRTFVAGLSPKDRWRLTNTLYSVWAENRRKALEEGTKPDDLLMELAWYVHP